MTDKEIIESLLSDNRFFREQRDSARLQRDKLKKENWQLEVEIRGYQRKLYDIKSVLDRELGD